MKPKHVFIYRVAGVSFDTYVHFICTLCDAYRNYNGLMIHGNSISLHLFTSMGYNFSCMQLGVGLGVRLAVGLVGLAVGLSVGLGVGLGVGLCVGPDVSASSQSPSPICALVPVCIHNKYI